MIAKKFGWRRLRGRGPDFETPEGGLVELKTDRYSSTDTRNFFVERYGNVATKRPGGPWKAVRDKCDGFLYFFRGDGKIYGFKTAALMAFLKENLDQYASRKVRNKKWVTFGYLIPISDLEHLAKINDLPPTTEA